MNTSVLRPAVVCITVLSAAVGAVSQSEPVELDKANALISKEKFQQAIDLLNPLCQANAEDTAAFYLRGYSLYRLQELDRAKADFERVVKISQVAPRSSYFLGMIFLKQGHPEKAVSWLEPAAEAKPPVEDAPQQLSKAYFDSHQLENARMWTEKSIQLMPWSGGLHYRMGRIYQQLNLKDQASKEFQISLSLKGSDKDAVRMLLDSSQGIARGDITIGREARSVFLKQQQTDPDVLVALGSEFASAGFPEDSLELFREAARRDPSSFQAHFDLALALLNLSRPAEAVAPLEESLKIAPSSIDAKTSLGLSYVLLGQFQEALPLLESVYRAQPSNAKTAGLLGVAYLRTGSAQKAIPIIEKILQKQPDEAKLYFLLIECLNGSEKQVEALEVAAQAAARFPTLAKAHLAKGQQLARLGRYREAGPCFQRAVEIAPRDIDSYLGLAETQNKSGSYDASLASYKKALEIDPENLAAQLGAGKNLVALRRLPEAQDLLEKAATLHPGSPQVHFELSRIYARLGADDRAAEQTQIVQQLQSGAPR